MAIWQYGIMLLPRQWAEANKHKVMDFLTDDGWELGEAWQEWVEVRSPEKIIDQHMTRAKSWHEDLTVWGDEQTDDIGLFREVGKIESLHIRIDVRKKYLEMVQKSVIIAKELDCSMLLMSDNVVAGPSVDQVVGHIERSRAMRIVRSGG